MREKRSESQTESVGDIRIYLHPGTKIGKLPSDNVNQDSHVCGVEHPSRAGAAKQVQQEFRDGVWTARRGNCYRILYNAQR